MSDDANLWTLPPEVSAEIERLRVIAEKAIDGGVTEITRLNEEIERLTAEVERMNAMLDVATKMHDRLMDERNKLREELAQTNAMFKQR